MCSIFSSLLMRAAMPGTSATVVCTAFATGAVTGVILPAVAESLASHVLRSFVEGMACPVAPERRLVPLTALANAFLCALCVARFGLSPTGLAAWLLCCSLIVCCYLDFWHHLLPDALTGPLLWLGLLLNTTGRFVTLQDAVLGAAASYLLLRALSWVAMIAARSDGIGHGDFKLLAALGAWFGWQALPVILIAASGLTVLAALPFAHRGLRWRSRVPFGPSLAVAATLTLFAPAYIAWWRI